MLIFYFALCSLGAMAQGNSITLEANQTELPAVLRQIERQSGYYKLGYDADLLRQFKVTASIKDKSAVDAVKTVIAGLPLQAVTEGKFISIKSTGVKGRQEQSSADSGVLTGVVIDQNGDPLAGVSISNRAGMVIGLTDTEGHFSISSKDAKVKLKFSYIGMNPIETTVTNGHPVNIVMSENSTDLSEVVVTGYQVVDKRASTSAITSIKAEDVIRPDALSIDQMLEGKIPDMMFMSNSGEAGVAPKIRIRGTSSIIGNREPLWVVDGIVVSDPVNISPEELNDPDYINRIGNAIAGLNPQDIERLDVLKDASATALYGTKAANGVIVITTKRGKEGAPTIRYNNSFTWKLRPRYTDRSVDVLNSQERTQLSKELWDSHYVYGSAVSMVGYDLLKSQLYNGEITQAEFDAKLPYYETVNTDWFDLLTHNSFSQAHTLAISGGGDRASYYGSLGFTDNDDVVKGTTNRRYNAMVNLDVKFSKMLTASFSIKGNVSNREYYHSSLNPVEYAYKSSRAIPAYDNDGNYEFYRKNAAVLYGYNYNILNELENSSMNQNGSSVTFDTNLRFKFNSWLSANAIFSYTNANTKIDSYWGAETWHMATIRGCDFGETPSESSLAPQGGQLNTSENKNKSWTARFQLDWNKYFADDVHNFSGSLGFEANQNKYESFSYTARGYYPDRGLSFAQGIDLSLYTGYVTWLANNVPTIVDTKSNTVSGYLSLSYNYNRLVFFNINGRIDGSNNFGDRANDKLLPIWSISGSFDAKRLSAFEQLTWLDYFSIKGSFGYQGNMLSTQTPVMIIRKGAYNDFYGEYMSTVERNPNPDLKWEKTTSYNLGFEWGFFNRRLEIDASLYWKRTKDAFMDKSVSTINGYSSYIVNGGDIDNKGYSVGVTVRPIQSKNWQWSVSTNFSRNINRIKSTPSGEQYELSNFLNGSAVVKGQPIGTFYSYRFLGLSPIDGGPMFDDWFDHYEDLVGKSKYDTYTMVLSASGNREPYMQGGLSTQLRYKSVRMSASFTYSLGGKTRLFGMYGAGTNGGSIYAYKGKIKPENNLSRDLLNRWRHPGDEKFTNIPAIINQIDYDAYSRYLNHWSSHVDGVQEIADNYWDMYDYSDLRVVSSDYLKLQNVSVYYELPKQWLTGFGIKRLEVNAAASNLFTICDSKLKGQTPTQGGFTDIQLSDRPGFSFGLNVTF